MKRSLLFHTFGTGKLPNEVRALYPEAPVIEQGVPMTLRRDFQALGRTAEGAVRREACALMLGPSRVIVAFRGAFVDGRVGEGDAGTLAITDERVDIIVDVAKLGFPGGVGEIFLLCKWKLPPAIRATLPREASLGIATTDRLVLMP